ncbi:MAG: potassium channel family protein [Actinomycetota bacterium]|nr:potassium channel family protein [Actinomycetota bacterium]
MIRSALPFYTLLFAAAYVLMAGAAEANFSESLSRTDALYFSVTIVTTVGFGDITAKTEVARLLVAAQMFGDLLLLGLGLKLLLGATQFGQQHDAVVTDEPADETHGGTFT